MNQTKLTVERVMALGPCDDWPEERVRAALTPLPENDEEIFDVLSRINPYHARWLVSRLMAEDNAVVWARACAERAKTYSSFVSGDPEDYGDDTLMAIEYADSAENNDDAYDNLAADAADAAVHAACTVWAAYLDCGRSLPSANNALEAEHHTALRHAISLIEPLGES